MMQFLNLYTNEILSEQKSRVNLSKTYRLIVL